MVEDDRTIAWRLRQGNWRSRGRSLKANELGYRLQCSLIIRSAQPPSEGQHIAFGFRCRIEPPSGVMDDNYDLAVAATIFFAFGLLPANRPSSHRFSSSDAHDTSALSLSRSYPAISPPEFHDRSRSDIAEALTAVTHPLYLTEFWRLFIIDMVSALVSREFLDRTEGRGVTAVTLVVRLMTAQHCYA